MTATDTPTVAPPVLLSAAFDPQFYRVTVRLSAPAPGYLTLFCTYGPDAEWHPVRGGVLVHCGADPISVYDWEVPLKGPSARYRALAYAQVGQSLFCSAEYSNVMDASPPPKGENWWLKTSPEPG